MKVDFIMAPSLRLGAPTALLIVTLLPGRALAGHPFATDDAGTVGAAVIELELALTAVHWSTARPLRSEIGSGVAVHGGLAPTVDLGLGVAYAVAREDGEWSAGMEPPALDLKWRVVDSDGAVPGLAIRLDYQAPQRLGALSTGHELGGLLIASWELDRVAIHVDAGAYAHMVSSNPEADGHVAGYLSFAFATEVAPGWFVGGEATMDGVPLELHGASGLAALWWEPAPGRTVSLGIAALWEEDRSAGWMSTLGFTGTFGGLTEPSPPDPDSTCASP